MFIFSTDKDFTKRKNYRGRNGFVSFMRKGGKPRGIVNISQKLLWQTPLSTYAKVGIDKENNEMIICFTHDGNLKVVTSPSLTHIVLHELFIYAGYDESEIPVGRFTADIDKHGYIHVYLNKPL